MPFESLRKGLFDLGVVNIDVDSKHVFSSIVLLNAHSTDAGHLEQMRGVPALDFFQFRFSSHESNISQIQAKVTPRA